MIAFFYYLLEVCKVRFPIGMKVGPTVELNEGDKIVNEYSCAIRSRLAPEFLKLNFIECLIQLKFYLFRRNSSRRWHSSLLNWRTIMWCPLYTAPCRHRIALHYNKNDFSIFFLYSFVSSVSLVHMFLSQARVERTSAALPPLLCTLSNLNLFNLFNRSDTYLDWIYISAVLLTAKMRFFLCLAKHLVYSAWNR